MLKNAVIFSLCLVIVASFALSETVVRTLEVKENASGLAFDGTNLWHGIYGANSDWLYKIDYTTGDILDSIPNPGDDCFGLTWDGTYLWVMCAGSQDSIYQIDTLGGLISAFPALADYHAGLAWDGSYLWNGRYYPDPGPIFKLDPSNGNALDSIPPPEDQTWDLTWDGTYLWVCDKWADSVFQVDTTDGSIQLSFASPLPDPTGLAWDGIYLWLADWNGMAYQIDPYGGGIPEISLSANEHDYGNVAVGDSSVWELGITNTGTADLIVDSLIIDNPVFYTNVSFPDTIEPDSTLSVPIVFKPTSIDAFAGTATVYSNDPISPEEHVSLNGAGIAQGVEIHLPETSHDYGTIRVRASKRWFCEIQNLGSDTLVIDSVVSDAPEFHTADTYPIFVESASGYDLSVWFSPPATGSFSGSLIIYNNDTDEPEVTVLLSGWGEDSPNPGGEVLWYYNATDYDPSIKALRPVPDINGDGVEEVVAGSENDTIYCFNGNGSGEADVLWTYVTSPLWREQELVSVPDLDGDQIDDIVIGTPWGGCSVIALSGVDGDSLWSYDTHEHGGGWVYEVAQMVDVNGDDVCDVLAAAGDDGNGTGPCRVYCLSGLDGSKIWERRLGPVGISVAVFSVRAIDDITGDGIPEVAAGSGNGTTDVARVWMLNGATGSIIWSEIMGDAVWSVVPIEDISGDDIMDVVAGIGVFSGSVRALDATDGAELWSRAMDGGVETVHIIGDVNADGIDDVLPSGLMSSFYCLDGMDGSVIWSKNSGHKAFTAVPIPDLTGDLKEDVIAGSGYNYNVIYCLNGATGDTVWTYPADGAVEVVYWMHSVDRQTADALSGSRNGEVLCLSGGLTLFGAIEGGVTDEITSLPIESAVVAADGHMDTTDMNGDYSFFLSTGFYEVIVTAEDYYPDTAYVAVTANDTFLLNFALTPVFVPPQFIRADADADSMVDMSDVVYTLKYLYVPGSPEPPCVKAADADDNGDVLMPDAIYTLQHLYVPGAPDPPSPFPDCGIDPTSDFLDCLGHPCMDSPVTQPVKEVKMSK